MPSAVPLPAQPFFAQPGQRVGLARERFFDGQRPTGLVSEPVIQSWMRCVGDRRSPGEAVAFDPVTRSRLSATLERSRELRDAAHDEIARLESALGGSACRVLLTDADGVIVHATPAGTLPEPVLKRVARVGVNLAEDAVGTNAPAVVVKTGGPVTVLGAEHFFDCVRSLYCAAAPIRDGRGRLAGVLDLTVEARPFGFDAAALVGVYATAIENRLLQAAGREHLVLAFQVCRTMIGTPLQALVGIDSRGRVAWLNGTAGQLIGRGAGPDADAGALLGETASQLLARAADDDARPLRLPNGLTVWLRATLATADAPRRSVVVAAALPPVAAPEPALAAAAPAAAPPGPAATAATLQQQAREVIERALADNGGNISRTARQLGVSRGLLYRRLREG